MLEIPAFQFSRFPEVAAIGELQVQNAACTVAELPIGNFLVRSLAPSRINRPGRIPVQTAAEKWTAQDYRCAQRDEVNLWPATEPMPLYRSDPFQKSPASFHLHQASACLQTPTSDASDAISQLHPAHGRAKTHMEGSLPFLHYAGMMVTFPVFQIPRGAGELESAGQLIGICFLPPGTISSAWTRER